MEPDPTKIPGSRSAPAMLINDKLSLKNVLMPLILPHLTDLQGKRVSVCVFVCEFLCVLSHSLSHLGVDPFILILPYIQH